nr:hypothetical protein [uncultured Campylobacter sp.]
MLDFWARRDLGDFAEPSLKSINLRAKFTVAPQILLKFADILLNLKARRWM